MATVPANAVVYIATDGGIQCRDGLNGNGYSVVDIAVFVDNVLQTPARRIIAANTPGVLQNFGYWGFSYSQMLSAGTHTIDVRASWVAGTAVGPMVGLTDVSNPVFSGPLANFGNNAGRLSVAILKQ